MRQGNHLLKLFTVHKHRILNDRSCKCMSFRTSKNHCILD
ncbi:MAG TPA: hypothetical protein DCY45_07615 [Mesotoga sp.]|nr:hypothetical protein [Mesotoga sp.]